MTIPELKDKLRAYIVDSFLSDPEAGPLGDGDDLFHRLDSLQVLRLVVQLEPLFGVKVENSELTAENLGSVAKTAAFVARKRRAARRTRPGRAESPRGQSLDES